MSLHYRGTHECFKMALRYGRNQTSSEMRLLNNCFVKNDANELLFLSKQQITTLGYQS